MPLLISGRDQVRRDLRSRMTLAYTVDNLLLGFRLVGDLPGGVLNLKLPTTCLISVRRQILDRPVMGVRGFAKLLVLLLPDVPVQLALGRKSTAACRTLPLESLHR